MFSKEVEKQIKAYLKKVRRATTDRTSTEQRELLQSVEEHIHAAIESRAGGQPSSADVADVISSMDPPESFAGEVPGAGEFSYGRINAGNIGFVALIVLFSAIAIPIIGAILEAVAPMGGDLANPMMFAGIILLVIALVLGIIGRRQPAGKAAMIASIVLLASLTVFVPVNRRVSSTGGPEEMRIEAPHGESE